MEVKKKLDGVTTFNRTYPDDFDCRWIKPYYIKGNTLLKIERKEDKAYEFIQEDCEVAWEGYANSSSKPIAKVLVYCNGSVTYFGGLTEIPSFWVSEDGQLIGCEYPA